MPIRMIRINRETLSRVFADVAFVNLALVLALVIRFLWVVGIEGSPLSGQALLDEYMQIYLRSSVLLTGICLIIFHLNGFYTHSRLYQHRYKALVILQAVSLSFLVFSFLVFLLWDVIWFPRSMLLPTWLLTLIFVMGARFALHGWGDFVIGGSEADSLAVSPSSSGRHILVIGGAGYIGSALLPRLLDKGYTVRLLDLFLYGTEPIQDLLYHPNLEIVQADLRQVDSVVEAMRGIDTVIHLGAIVGDPACDLNEDLTVEVNLTATRMIAEVAKGSGVRRFVFASTCSVYGAADEILNEQSVSNPVSLYARSKIASERVLLPMAGEDFAPVILRFGTIYGFSGRTRFDLVINLLTAKAMLDGAITIFGGDQWRPFLHVDDAALAVFKAMEAPTPLVHSQVFNVGSNEQNYTIQTVGEMIQARIPSAHLTSQGLDADLRNYRVDFTKIRQTLGFKPQWTVEDGIQQVVESIESGQVVDYQAPQYSNVKSLVVGEDPKDFVLRRQNDWVQKALDEPLASSNGLVPAPA